MALIEKLKAIGDAIRGRTGTTGELTLDEMAEAIESMEAGTDDGTNTYILVDENGYEIPAVLVDEEVTLTATPNDIRIGTTAVTEEGVVTGEKEIPSYNTSEGFKGIPNGSKFILPLPNYEYTKLQAIFCPFNTSMSDSVSAERVALNDSVYPVLSTVADSKIIVDGENKRIDFGLTNTSGKMCLIRYFTYKEIY